VAERRFRRVPSPVRISTTGGSSLWASNCLDSEADITRGPRAKIMISTDWVWHKPTGTQLEILPKPKTHVCVFQKCYFEMTSNYINRTFSKNIKLRNNESRSLKWITSWYCANFSLICIEIYYSCVYLFSYS